MDRGLLDAAGLNNPSSDIQLGLPDVAKFYMMGSHHRPAGALEIVFNKAKHDALPAEIKSILRHAAFAASTAQLGMAYARYPKDLDEIRKRGVNVVRTGDAVLRAQLAAWDKVIAEHSKEPFFAKVIASQKAWVRRLQPYLAANNLGSGELAAAYQAFLRLVGIKERVMIGRKWSLRLALCVLMAGAAGSSLAQQNEFPFDGELILDVRPMPGSKRIPNMDIAADGAIVVEMWCNRVDGQMVVAGDTITVMTGQPTDRPCTPERARGDAELLEALNAVTNWRREGDFVRLIGPKTLRFRVPTN